MTSKQKRARRINFSLMQLSSIRGQLKGLKDLYPEFALRCERLDIKLRLIMTEIKSNRDNPKFKVNF